MIEVIFPLLGSAFVVLILLPAFALVAKAGLVLLERDEMGGPLHGLGLRYLILTGSSALPLAWFFSAGLHQVDAGTSAIACLFDHDGAELCFEPGLFALLLGLAIVVALARVLRKDHRVAAATSVRAKRTLVRVQRLLGKTPELHDLAGRLVVTDEPGFALGTHGFLRPRVFVGSNFVRGLTDEMLASALAHEAEHVRARDPLRYLLLQLALAINPLGRFLLEGHVARWHAAREAHCDREAVIHGASPLPLADAIVRAARPAPRQAVALGARNVAVLKFRVGLLLAFAERKPARCCHRGPSTFTVDAVLLLLVLILPHQTDTAALDVLHAGAEHALIFLWP